MPPGQLIPPRPPAHTPQPHPARAQQVYRTETTVAENKGKSPTTVLLDPSRPKRLLAMGLDALRTWQAAEEGAQANQTTNSLMLFDEFKMLLRDPSVADRGDPYSFRAVSANGWTPGAKGAAGRPLSSRPFPLLLPVARLLEGIKNNVARHLHAADSTFEPEMVAWCVTVPA